jgi:hypothetical protein
MICRGDIGARASEGEGGYLVALHSDEGVEEGREEGLLWAIR